MGYAVVAEKSSLKLASACIRAPIPPNKTDPETLPPTIILPLDDKSDPSPNFLLFSCFVFVGLLGC